MATSVFRHSDDDGAVSVFISGTQILFVCELRHWWTVEAGESGQAQKAAAKRVLSGAVPKRLGAADKSVIQLSETFGPGVFDAMTLK